jgi:hypothetical protein
LPIAAPTIWRKMPGGMSSLRFLLAVGLLAFAAPPSFAQKALPSFSDADAGQHVGEEAIVTGKVSAVSKSGKGNTFLNLGGRFPNHTFAGVVFARDAEKLGDLKTFEGKTVALRGRIELGPDQKPQIVISTPEQIQLAEPGAPAPAAAPMPTPAAPVAGKPAAPAPAPKPEGEARKIVLAQNWSSPLQGGEMTRKDLARLFAGQGTGSASEEVDPASIILYQDLAYLTPLAEARKRLNLENTTPDKARVTTPGMPLGSFTAHEFTGVFEGGYTRLCLITDNAEQLVSVLAVDENTRERTKEIDDSFGYHTYNFISHRVKGVNELVVRHELAKSGRRGLVVVESVLIDPTDTANLPKPRSSSTRTTTTKYTPRSSRDGKVRERSQWFVPVPVVDLILRACIRAWRAAGAVPRFAPPCLPRSSASSDSFASSLSRGRCRSIAPGSRCVRWPAASCCNSHSPCSSSRPRPAAPSSALPTTPSDASSGTRRKAWHSFSVRSPMDNCSRKNSGRAMRSSSSSRSRARSSSSRRSPRFCITTASCSAW